MNWVAQNFADTVATLDVDYPALPAALRELTRAGERARADAYRLQGYNVAGRIHMQAQVPDWGGFAVRLADSEGCRRAAILTADLRVAGADAAHLPALLAQAALRNPYTQVPFAWDAHNAMVVFTGLEPGERGRHGFVL